MRNACASSLAGAGSITIVNRPEDAALAKSLMELLNKIAKKSDFVTWDHTYAVPADTDILVNATPIGLYPNVDEIPNIDLEGSEFLYDGVRAGRKVAEPA